MGSARHHDYISNQIHSHHFCPMMKVARWKVPEEFQLCGQELLEIEGTLIPCRFHRLDSQFPKIDHFDQGNALFLDVGVVDRDQHQRGHLGGQRPDLLGDPHLHRAEHHQVALDQDQGDGLRLQGGRATER